MICEWFISPSPSALRAHEAVLLAIVLSLNMLFELGFALELLPALAKDDGHVTSPVLLAALCQLSGTAQEEK